jgi:hypothetical protein
MKATLLMAERHVLAEDAFAEVRIWRLPRTVPGSTHDLKYRLAYVVDGNCVLRYDNEAGKGDHVHMGTAETRYDFVSIEQLLDDFWDDISKWRPK